MQIGNVFGEEGGEVELEERLLGCNYITAPAKLRCIFSTSLSLLLLLLHFFNKLLHCFSPEEIFALSFPSSLRQFTLLKLNNERSEKIPSHGERQRS